MNGSSRVERTHWAADALSLTARPLPFRRFRLPALPAARGVGVGARLLVGPHASEPTTALRPDGGRDKYEDYWDKYTDYCIRRP